MSVRQPYPMTESGIDQMSMDPDAYVRNLVQRTGSSFFWAMRLLPPSQRQAMFAIYAFCREIDDIADGDAGVVDPKAALGIWRRHIADMYSGQARHPVTKVLLPVIKEYRLEKQDFLAIIDGMETDATGPVVAPTLNELDIYCDRVASAVGRLSVCIFGERGEVGQETARELGRALQLTNILRDVGEDAVLGRLYLPLEILKEHGITVSQPEKVILEPALDAVCRDMAERAEAHFERAEAAIAKASRQSMRPAIIMLKVYRRILARLKRRGWSPEAVVGRQGYLSRLAQKAEKLLIGLYYRYF